MAYIRLFQPAAQGTQRTGYIRLFPNAPKKKVETKTEDRKQTPQLQSRFSITPQINEPLVGSENVTGASRPATLDQYSPTGEKVGKFLASIPQGIAQSGAKITLATKDIIQRKKEPSALELDPQASNLEKAFFKGIFGTERVSGFAEDVAGAELAVKPFLGEKKSRFAVAPTLIGLTAFDFTGFGGGKNALLKALVKESDEAVVRGMLKQVGVADDLIPAYATKFAKTQDAKVIEQGLKNLEKIQGGTKAGSQAIPSDLQPLTTEARKYKSVEEFVGSSFKAKINPDDTLRETLGKLREQRTKIEQARDAIQGDQATASEARRRVNLSFELDNINNTIKEINGVDQYGHKTLTDFYNQVTKGTKKPVIIDPDLYKKKFNDFDPTHHERYSAMAKAEYAKKLAENKNPVVKFTAGGSASGKSEFVLPRISRNYDGIILDGTLADYGSAIKKINQAEQAGKQVEIHAALSRIDSAWRYAQKRATDTGRYIRLPDFIEKHTGALDTLERLVKEKPNLKITLKDTRGATTRAEALALPLVENKKELLARIGNARAEMKKLIPTLTEEAGTLPKLTQSQQISKVGQALPEPRSTLSDASRGTLSKAPEVKVSPKPLQVTSVRSLSADAKALQTNAKLNVANYTISKEGKQLIDQTVDEVKPMIEAKIGRKLSNQAAIKEAESSSRVLRRAISREETLDWEAAMLRTRQQLAMAAENGKVDKSFIENLLTVKTMGTDIARKLQSLSIKAEEATSMQMILEAVVRQTDDITRVYNAAKGVDFNDFKQATAFYRQFIKPTAGEWIDALRYNSMLSSPNTHIINTFSNAINSIVFAPLTKAVAGGLDFLGATITGKGRTQFASEAGVYLKGYLSNVKEATRRFSDVMRGKRMITHLDVRNIPLATSGAKGKISSVLNFPMKLLEASDQFFTALTAGGETAALGLRASKGVKVGNIAIQAEQKAAYRLFRQELFPEGQGMVLDAIDHFTNFVSMGRNSKNPIVSTISKFTVPFLRTPMNIFKQGVEYSPLGLTTLAKNTNKTEQLAKAIIGSSIFAGAGLMVASDRLTFEEPASATQRDAWRAAGKQAYSIKIGDKWYSYQKLPPPLAYPIALVAAINDVQKNKGADDDWGDAVLSGVAKYGSFLADQSYAKSFGDLLDAVQGAESSISRLISNYPQQLIPFRALGGWFARLFDESQRKVDNKAGFIDKQMQQLMLNIPFLSQKVPARVDAQGNPVDAPDRYINAFSPIRVSQINKELETFLNLHQDRMKADREKDDRKAKDRARIQPIYDQAQKLKAEGNETEASRLVNDLSDADYEIYKNIKSSEKTKQTNILKDQVYPIFKQAQELKASGNMQAAQELVDELSDEEYKVYQSIKKAYAEE